jgi:molybdenum cofactor guanylyltransferase
VRTGIVLAGGRSSRFGGDKLMEGLDGDALLERAVAAVRAVADEVIVAGRPGNAASPTIRSFVDAEPFGGPLLALLGVLREARGAVAVIVGGDMPRLVPAVLRAMLDRIDQDAAIDAVLLGQPPSSATSPAASPGRRAVLPLAVQVPAALGAAEAAVGSGDRSLQALVDRLAHVELPASTWLALDPEGSTLLDVDTRADLERIRPR